MPVDSQVVFTSESAPVSGTARLYVDGTLGDDAAAGTSWATAWGTYAKFHAALASLLLPCPLNLTVILYVRGNMDGQELRLEGNTHGTTAVHVIHHMDDWTTVRTGTLTTIAATTKAHGMRELTFTGFVPDTSDEGLAIVCEDGAGQRLTYQALYVAAGVVTMNATSVPAWVIGGDVINVTFRKPSISMVAPGKFYYALRSTDAGLGGHVVMGIPSAEARAESGAGWASLALWAKGSYALHVVNCTLQTAVAWLKDPVLAVEWGLLGTNVGDLSAVALGGHFETTSATKGISIIATIGAKVLCWGWCNSALQAFDGSNVTLVKCRAGVIETNQGHASTVNTILCGYGTYGYGVRSNHGGSILLSTTSFLGLPAAGLAYGLASVYKGGWCQIQNTVDGINTGTAVSGLVAVKVSIGGSFEFSGAVNPGLDGKHGLLDARDAHVTTDTDTIRSIAAPGGGPDLYIDGGEIYFAGSWTRSVVNTIPSPMLQVGRGGKVTQAAGKTFTVATPAADWVASYGAKGAIVADDGPVDIRLGTLGGGAAGVTTGVGCTLGKGTKLVHAGAGLLGVAPLKLGGAVAQAWPAAPTSDLAAGVPEDCWIYPNVA